MKNKLRIELLRVRPKYNRVSILPPCHIIDKIQEELIAKREVGGSTFKNDATLKMHGNRTRFWSPVFDISVVKNGKGSIIRGIVGPKPKIWAVFIFFYTLAAILFFLGILMLIYQWLFDMDELLVWSVPASIIIVILVTVAAKIGQQKGSGNACSVGFF